MMCEDPDKIVELTVVAVGNAVQGLTGLIQGPTKKRQASVSVDMDDEFYKKVSQSFHVSSPEDIHLAPGALLTFSSLRFPGL